MDGCVVLGQAEWRRRQTEHERAVDRLTAARRVRARRQLKHPVE
ncbi:MAG: hypothetical protein RLZ55_586, partial [Actinomycetota bacterium]